jgi:hypothetical protein
MYVYSNPELNLMNQGSLFFTLRRYIYYSFGVQMQIGKRSQVRPISSQLDFFLKFRNFFCVDILWQVLSIFLARPITLRISYLFA